MLAYGRETGRFAGDAELGTRDLWEFFVPPVDAAASPRAARRGVTSELQVKACLVDGGAAHAMCAYNRVAGVPACASRPLLTGLLRGAWAWEGFVVSDYDACAARAASRRRRREM